MKNFLLLSFLLLFLFSSNQTWAQQRTVSGKVTSSSDGVALPGVNVVVKGTTTGTVTDIDGNYTLSVPSDGGVLTFSFIGLASREVQIGSRSSINVEMDEDAKQLNEVVVQAYGQQSEKLNIQQVETVGSNAIENRPILSPQEALQGQAGGVQVMGSSGTLGTAQNVRIRGVTSITSGTQPLYVIDGVPLNDNSAGGTGYSGTAGGGSALNPIFDLNPNDIESMTVLKDASATALYGSRGANGVIIITTKKGARGEKTKFSANYFTGWSEATVFKDVLSADQFRQFRADYSTATGTPATPEDFNQGGFDWLDGVTKTGRTNSYSMSARGGTEKTAFYVGGTYMNADSYQIGNEVEKLNGRFNLSHQASDAVSLGFNLGISRLDNDRFFQENSTGSPLTVAYLQLPYVEPLDEDGNPTNAGYGNPIYEQEMNKFQFISRRNTGNIYLQVKPIENLILKTDWGIDMIQTETTSRDVDFFSPGGYAYKAVVQDNKWLNTNTANYNFGFGESNFSVLAGFSFETSKRNDITVEGSGFVSDELPNVGSAGTPTTTSATGAEWALFSTFGRLNYDLKNKYLFEASIRRDGSSRFGSGNRFGVFWAVSGGWLISDEDFFPESGLISFLKLTSSYGTSGNDRIGNYASLGLYTGGRDYNGNPGIEASQAANSDLTWEQTAQLDISLDARFFSDRLRVNASWYQKNTTDLLLSVPVPRTTGFTSRIQNIGEVVNRGIDLTIAGDVIDNNGLKWTITGNLGYLHNEVLSLPEGSSEDLDGNKFVTQASFSSQRAVEGRSINEWFLVRYKGVNPETGDPEWLDKNGEVTNTPNNPDDRVFAGSALPKFTGGLTNQLYYKGFDLRVFVNFVSGGKTYLADNEFSNNIASGGFNHTRDVLNYWTKPGDKTFAPYLGSEYIANFDNESTLHLFDASYIRVKNITLGYKIPQNILEKSRFLSDARVYAMVQNAFTFASDLMDEGTDPEVSNGGTSSNSAQAESFYTSPQSRTFTVGVSLGF
ncbi:SusC/RagA family TonB-linked outer membrane protein [Fulvivirga sediminis]|uniref:SusC/RagA family TonB-linked outer membrane protein n=1 Tax=Fulvivirga sediminis TaxID=2803949 RepID=A0A937F8M0_9BACT|nr:SusC/RagA family TonB-linked outer membrane protein [Fulvivirga sediminis]MBL3656053.1 SusC/RagA family TonB-linked outer membrane protein [Fulvivirga sediminis]